MFQNDVYQNVDPPFAHVGYQDSVKLVGKPVLKVIAVGEKQAIVRHIEKRARGKVV